MHESTKKTKTAKKNNSTSTSSLANEVCDSIRESKGNALGLLDEYFDAFAESMEKISMQDRAEDCEPTIKSIDDFLPYRDEIIKVFSLVARYFPDEKSTRTIHKFFERVLPYYNIHRKEGRASDIDTDNFKFLVHEMFLYAIAAFIKQEEFEQVAYLTDTPYYVPNSSNNNPTVDFDSIREYLKSFDIRNSKMELGKRSLRAEYLMKRVDISGFNRIEIIQADFVLTIKSAALNMTDTQRYSSWYPDTCIYAYGFHPLTLEIFARGVKQKYFDKIKVMLGADSPDKLKRIIESIGGRHGSGFEYAHSLANIKNLCQSP